MGTMSVARGAMHQAVDEQQAIRTVHAALDHGINLFDTAPAYGEGESEQRLGRALAGRKRDAYFVATKASGPTLSAAEIAADCDASLSRLGTGHIDLYQIHWMKQAVPFEETIGAMDALVRAGKVRKIGVCNAGPVDTQRAMNLAESPIVSVQVVYNLLSRAFEFSLQEFCLRNRLGMLCYSPLAQGLLAGLYQSAGEVPNVRARSRHFRPDRPTSRHGEPGCEAETFAAVAAIRQIAAEVGLSMADLSTAWLLHQHGVTAVLAGASKPEQAIANARAASVTLSPVILKRLNDATDTLKARMGPNLDMWQGAKDTRVR